MPSSGYVDQLTATVSAWPSPADELTHSVLWHQPRSLRGPSQGLGKTEGDLERIVYEATFPRGGALVIETLTDKRTRTVTLLRTLLHKHG